MKRWSALPLAILGAFLLLVASARAEMYDYTFEVGDGQLTDMTGADQLLGSDIDEQPSGVFDIGFTFYFDGQPYTQFSADPNGYMQLGGSSLPGYTYGDMYYFYYGSYYQGGPILFPWASNQFTITDGVRSRVTGLPGSRVLSVEWNTVHESVYWGYSRGSEYRYQVRLYEGSNRVEFVYGQDMQESNWYDYGYVGMSENLLYGTDMVSLYFYNYNTGMLDHRDPYIDYYSIYNNYLSDESIDAGTMYIWRGCEQEVIGDESQGWATEGQADTLFLNMAASEIGQNTTYYPFALSMSSSVLCVPSDMTYNITGASASEYNVYGPSTVYPGDYQSVQIDFVASGPGRRYATLEMTGQGFSRTLVLAAEGLPRLEWNPDLAQGGSPSLLDHDTLLTNQFISLGNSQTLVPITIRWFTEGTSEIPANISYSLTGTNPEYSILNPQGVLYGPGEEKQVEIVFTPMHVGRSVDTLTVIADGETRIFILNAFGSGRGGQMTAMLDGVQTRLDSSAQLFRMQYVCAGDILSIPVTVSNTGTELFTINSIDIYNTDTVVRQGQPRYPLLEKEMGEGSSPIPSTEYMFTEGPAVAPLAANPAISFPYSLQPGETRTWYLTFSTGRSGMRFARAFIHTDAQLIYGKDRFGETVEGLYEFDLFGRGSVPSLSDNLEGGNMKPVLFTPTELGAAQQKWVYIANAGTCAMQIDSSALRIVSGDVHDFRIVSLPASWFPNDGIGQYSMAPGAIDSFLVEFTPLYGGSRRASILFRTNDSMMVSPDNVRGEYYLDLVGVGGTGLYGSNLTLGTGEIGNTTGPWSNGQVVLTNTSAGDITITNLFWEGADSVDFVAQGWPVLPAVVPPSGMTHLTVEFKPMGGAPGTRQATLVAVTSAGDTIRSTVSGTAGTRSLIVNPTAVAFPAVRMGRVIRQMVAVQNIGSMPIKITSVTISGTDAADFKVAPLVRSELAPGQTELLEVTFSRATAGASTASLDIVATNATVQVPLTAMATLNRYKDDDPDGATIGQGGKDAPVGNGVEFGVAGVAADKAVSSLLVAPNPVVSSEVEVSYRAVRGGEVRLELVNASGAVVSGLERSDVAAGVEQRERLNVAGLGSGVYLLRVVTADGIAVRSVVIAR